MRPASDTQTTACGPRAGVVFASLAGVFAALFAGMLLWLMADQHALLQTMETLEARTLPKSVEQQRLARNLEVLRLEGERVISARTPHARRQALLVVTLMASHPSLLGNERARELAIETELFLGKVVRSDALTEPMQAEWQQISRRLSLAADDISVEGINLARSDVATMGKTVEDARQKLHIAAVIALVFLVTLLLLIRGLLVRPLQKFDTALARLSAERPALQLPACTLHEVRTIETAITQLHDVLVKHEQTREELEKLAATDMLTALHNRRNFMALAQAEIARSQRYGRPVSVALADLDHFKLVNDEHGHAVGDLALRAFADMVRDTLRTTDIAGRYGGEEFAFVFPETTPQEAAVLAERLRQRFEKLVITLDNGHALRLTTSLGVADASAISIEDALRFADHALYEAKAGGRNAVVMSAAVSGIGFIGQR